jgi:transcriptional regulator with XRE-family HTH domain
MKASMVAKTQMIGTDDRETQNDGETSTPADALAKVGGAIRELRHRRLMTVRTLAAGIDRSAGYVSQVERGLSLPSVKDLYAIANALDVPVSWFLDDSEPANTDERGVVLRHDKRRRTEADGLVTEVLSPRLDQGVEFMQTTFLPGAGTVELEVDQPGIETAVVLSGRLDLWVEGRHFALGVGDSYAVRLNQPHRSRNPSASEPTLLIWTVTRP